MKKDIFEIIKHDIHLTAEEKNMMRSFVISSMESNSPIKNYAYPLIGYEAVQTFFLSIIQERRVAVVLVLILLIGGGTTSVFAQNALPGDLLYPVKIHVNEQVESLLALGPKNNAEVNAKQAERRLSEVETLASQGKLNNQTNNELKNSFSQEVQSLNNNLTSLEKNGETTTASDLRGDWENKLKDHQKAVTLILSATSTSATEKTKQSNTQTIQSKKSEGDDEKNNEGENVVNNEKSKNVIKNSEQGNTIRNQESEDRGNNNSGNNLEREGDD